MCRTSDLALFSAEGRKKFFHLNLYNGKPCLVCCVCVLGHRVIGFGRDHLFCPCPSRLPTVGLNSQ